jgi:hypothetical protein
MSATLLTLWLTSALIQAILLSAVAPVSTALSRDGERLGLALLLWPFLLGVVLSYTLYIFPGLEPLNHIKIATCFQFAVSLFIYKKYSDLIRLGTLALEVSRSVWALLVCALAGTYLLFLSISAPLIENDALEYHLVAKEIFHSRSLASYPFVDSSMSSQGVYAPWTHPPFYVALIYGVFAAFGSVEYFWLSKLIPVFFLLVAAIAFGVLFSRYSRSWGAFLALFCFSIPLLTVGTESGAVDALVFAGGALLVCGFAIVDWQKPFAAPFFGVLIGLSVWPHSLSAVIAVMFVVATLAHLLRLFGRQAWPRLLVIMLCASIVGGWPYLKNIFVFGNILNDRPIGFLLQDLEWRLFFEQSRNIYDCASKLLFGLFRGWLRLDSFALTFWISTISVPSFIVGARQWRGSPNKNSSVIYGLWFASLAIVCLFFLAGVASIILNEIDFIKNDRYLLAVAPFAICLIGCVLCGPLLNAGTSRIEYLGKRLVAVMIVVQIAVVFVYIPYTRHVSVNASKRPLASLVTMRSLDFWVESGATVLSFRPADFFYSGRQLMSYLDPAVLDIYTLSTPKAVEQALRKKRINYIYLPEYMPPGLYNTALINFIADPNLTHLVHHDAFQQLYRVGGADEASDIQPEQSQFVSIGRGSSVGEVQTVLVAPVKGLNVTRYPFAKTLSSDRGGESVISPGWIDSFLRRRTTYRIDLRGDTAIGSLSHDSTGGVSGLEVRLIVRLHGLGFVSIYALEHRCVEMQINSNSTGDLSLVGSLVVGGRKPNLEFMRRWTLGEKTCVIDVTVERPFGQHRGVLISDVLIQRLEKSRGSLHY